MTEQLEDPRRDLRLAVYGLLIVISVGTMIGRICTVKSSLGETPLLSANDRSRWCTIRALVDHGTYVIDDVIFKDPIRKKRDREWYTIDMVRHKGHDEMEHYYSSKPPLLATMVAWEYWLIQRMTGATLTERPFYVVRTILILTNVLPLALFLCLLARLAERYGKTDWGRLFVVAAASFATFLTTFAVTLNNHVVAGVSAMIAVYFALPIWRDGERRWWYFAIAGFFAAFTAANEMPALSFFGLLSLGLLWRSAVRTLLAYVPAAAVVAVAFFITNHNAHNSLRPPYAHRGDGPLLATVGGDFHKQLDGGTIPNEVRKGITEAGVDLSGDAVVGLRAIEDGWFIWDLDGADRLAIVPEPNGVRVHAWDNWYDYDRTYWVPGKMTGPDAGERSRAFYAFNALIGHHGIFSLTPIWLFSVVGVYMWMNRKDERMRGFAVFVMTLTLVCLIFYLARPLKDRNYGGVSCGFRWMFWFTPLWLVAMLPAADRIARHRLLRYVAIMLLLLSVFSATYASLNPWSHPWMYRYWAYLGWIEL